MAMPKLPSGGGTEDHANIGVVVDLKVTPGARWVSLLQPKPSSVKRHISSLDTKAAELNGHSHPTIVGRTGYDILAAMPEEVFDHTISLLQDCGIVGHNREQVHRYSREHMAHQCKTFAVREQEGPPGI